MFYLFCRISGALKNLRCRDVRKFSLKKGQHYQRYAVGFGDTPPLGNVSRIALNHVFVRTEALQHLRDEFKNFPGGIGADKAIINGPEEINHRETDARARNRTTFAFVIADRCVVSHHDDKNIAFVFAAPKKQRVSYVSEVEYAGSKNDRLSRMALSDFGKLSVLNNHFDSAEL
jgi:hypothetical protein